MAKFILGAAMALVIAGCGGGAGDSPFESPPTKPASCTPKTPVVVALFGDSTMGLTGDRLQTYLDAKFGVGATVVNNYAVGGTSSAQAIAQIPTVAYDVSILNSAINDANTGVPVADFKANMLLMIAAAHIDMVETPSPITLADVGPYAAADRTLGVPVIDTTAYVLTVPNWQSMLMDGVHPWAPLETLIVNNSRGPGVAELVAPLRCVKS